MPKKETPTTRSIALLESQGYVVEKTEYRHKFSRVTFDLFGFCDLLAVRPGEVLMVQTTSGSSKTSGGNTSARVKKIQTECREKAIACLKAGAKIVVHGWSQKAEGWTCRSVSLRLNGEEIEAAEKEPSND